jgi:hypothetical protein
MPTPRGGWPRCAAAFGLAIAVASPVTAVTLVITANPNPAPAGTPVIFRIAPGVRSQADSAVFDFGDGGTGTITFTAACTLFGGCDTIEHLYAGPGTFTVEVTATLSGESVNGTAQVTVTSGTADDDIFVPTGAHLKGFNDVNWRTDLEVYNPGPSRATYQIALLLRDQDNSNAAFRSTFTLSQGLSARYNDLIYGAFGFSGAAAIRISRIEGTVIVTSRTYNQLPSGTYGQSVPAILRARAIAFGQDASLIGLSHDPSLAAGYRTNLGFVNASPAPIHVEADFYLSTSAYLGRKSYDLLPFEFRQIDKAFEQVTSTVVNDGYIIVRTTTAGAKFFAYAGVTDNITGDPTYVDALIPQ